MQVLEIWIWWIIIDIPRVQFSIRIEFMYWVAVPKIRKRYSRQTFPFVDPCIILVIVSMSYSSFFVDCGHQALWYGGLEIAWVLQLAQSMRWRFDWQKRWIFLSFFHGICALLSGQLFQSASHKQHCSHCCRSWSLCLGVCCHRLLPDWPPPSSSQS